MKNKEYKVTLTVTKEISMEVLAPNEDSAREITINEYVDNREENFDLEDSDYEVTTIEEIYDDEDSEVVHA